MDKKSNVHQAESFAKMHRIMNWLPDKTEKKMC